MNTPAHLAASLLVWRHETGWWPVLAVGLGSILPDLPMYGFYGYQKLVGRPESEVWGELYFDPSWQWVFDAFNSIPLAIAMLGLCYYKRCRLGMLIAGSALLHMCCDLPIHHDDGHRHFLPFTHWRFESPVSYWDPQHYGWFFAPLELVFSVVSSCYVAWRSKSLPMRITALATLSSYGVGIAFAAYVWIF